MNADLEKAGDEQEQENTGAVVPLYNKNGEPALDSKGTPVTVTLLGEYSDAVRNVQEAQNKKMLRDGVVQLRPGDLRARQVEAAAAAITAWTGVESGGQPLSLTPDNARRFLTAFPHYLKQVEAGIRNHASFFANS